MRASEQHALARSIRALAVGTVIDVDRRRQNRDVAAMAEREEQFQIKVSGVASDYVAWNSVFLAFDTQFTVATGTRESGLERPQVSVGVELTTVADRQSGAPADAGVVLTAAVREWRFDGAHTIDGATVLIGALSPGAELSFSGFVHITFQALGAPGDDQPDEGP